MSQKKARAAFESRLVAWAAARVPTLRIAFENSRFDPGPGANEFYLRAYQLPADTICQTLEGTHSRFAGVFQVSVCVPINVGSGAAGGIVEELAAQFPNNLRVTSSGVATQLLQPASAAAALQDETHYIVPVSWPYRADTVT